MSRLSHVNLSLSRTGDLPAAIYWSGIAPFYPREDLPRLELENGEEFSTSHFRPVLLRNDLPFTAVCYMFWAMLLLEGMAPISHVFFHKHHEYRFGSNRILELYFKAFHETQHCFHIGPWRLCLIRFSWLQDSHLGQIIFLIERSDRWSFEKLTKNRFILQI